ncbi:MAG: hypothetical protein IJK09_06690, partial [Prevotella sp.]|nr:hypothetical protein [Prevotella sp.]
MQRYNKNPKLQIFFENFLIIFHRADYQTLTVKKIFFYGSDFAILTMLLFPSLFEHRTFIS